MILFPLSGVMTLCYGQGEQNRSTIAIIGHEGIANCHLLFSSPTPNYGLAVHVEGEALAIDPDTLRQMLMIHHELRSVILHYGATMHLQIAATLRSSLREPIGARLARLLLMYHDRIEGDEIPIFHSTISAALSVRRASVTDAMHVLEGHHAIRDSRGRTTVLDRTALIEFAGSSYGLGEKICPYGNTFWIEIG